MAYSTIPKPTDYFEATTYTGGATDVSSLSFQPDFVWAKKRDGSENHGLFDAVRGATKTLNSNTTSAESTRSGSLTSFDNDGWSMGGSDGIISASGSTYVGWAWKANGAGSANTDGSISSTVSANTTAGFSIVGWTGNGNLATIGHGLGVKPSMYIVKNRSITEDWLVYHKDLTSNNDPPEDLHLTLSSTSAISNYPVWNDTAPTSSVFTVNNYAGTNGNGNNMFAYCFAEKKGYSKFGSYTANGNADGPFVYTGFKPAFVMFKKSSASGHWMINDNKRSASGGFNVLGERLKANETDAGATADYVDFLSNGFKLRTTSSSWNENNETFIFMAFAAEPLVANSGTNGVPATAR